MQPNRARGAQRRRKSTRDQVLGSIFSTFTKDLKEIFAKKSKDGHPAMKVVMTKGGRPELKKYVAKGAKRTTAMHNKTMGYIQPLAGDNVKIRDGLAQSPAPAEKGQLTSRSGAGKRDMNYFLADKPKAVPGTRAEIQTWFEKFGRYRMVVPQPQKDKWDAIDKLAEDTADGFRGTKTVTAEVHLVSWAKPNDPGYVDLGGMRSVAIESLKRVIMFTGGAVAGGTAVEESSAHTAVESGHAAHGVAETVERVRGKDRAAGNLAWSRKTAEKYLEFLVEVHEGEAVNAGEKFNAHETWRPTERQLVTQDGRDVTWPAITLEKIGKKVVNDLIPGILDELQREAMRR